MYYLKSQSFTVAEKILDGLNLLPSDYSFFSCENLSFKRENNEP